MQMRVAGSYQNSFQLIRNRVNLLKSALLRAEAGGRRGVGGIEGTGAPRFNAEILCN